jgi:peptidyl-dipeptidase A
MQKYEQFWKNANASHYTNADAIRKLTFLKNVGTAALPTASLTNLTQTRNRMTTVYNTARICPFDNQQCDLNNVTQTWALDPEIETRLKSSTNYDEQLYLWVRKFLF